ncbi:formate dehydrogenase accessory sulfurtransferase FdhD [Helicovermis profundi]|uniref:Sulfur carrier protein FdhD n=1 Tax=Helicovermis profundi TaxID=3065157 RepID=A0AAU9EQ26_9FIRM|nr:formate dehydrogenase accessory sulfurtransferase FdhD [Clostridia bacterium S502]
MSFTKRVEIKRNELGKEILKEDIVVIEEPFTMFINAKEFITLLCSPNNIKELIVGFLFSEGLIETYEDITSISVDKSRGLAYIYIINDLHTHKEYSGKRVITTGCGKGSGVYNFSDLLRKKEMVNAEEKSVPNEKTIFFIASKINDISPVFKETGGVHSCSLWEENQLIYSFEDIGRHNALDKIIGKILIEKYDVSNKILLSSGRISSEMLIKCAKIGIAVIISRSAPTSLAIKLSKELGVVLIGFARGKKFNIY